MCLGLAIGHMVTQGMFPRIDRPGFHVSYISCRCVNALSWAQGGQLLLSGGDDTTVRLWRMDQYEVDQEYPFVCRAVIRTGHRANIFNVALLPYSTKM
jgi:WD40 repeat protein